MYNVVVIENAIDVSKILEFHKYFDEQKLFGLGRWHN
jgi:hypothetical protein